MLVFVRLFHTIHHVWDNGPGIDRILREIERDGTSKKVSRREMGRHVDFVSSNSKCKSIQCREI